jgi:hypothetical protein
MNKIRLGLIIVLLGNALYAQQGIYTSKGKIINGECADYCFIVFDTRHGEQTFCTQEHNYPHVSSDVIYMITWKYGVIKVEGSAPEHCKEIIKVRVVR